MIEWINICQVQTWTIVDEQSFQVYWQFHQLAEWKIVSSGPTRKNFLHATHINLCNQKSNIYCTHSVISLVIGRDKNLIELIESFIIEFEINPLPIHTGAGVIIKNLKITYLENLSLRVITHIAAILGMSRILGKM